MEKKTARLRRAKSTRARIRTLGVPRLSVLRTGQHVYAQLFSADGSKVLAAASTTQAAVREGLKNGKNATLPPRLARRSPRRPRPLASRRLRSTVPATVTTVASRHWPTRPAKAVCSSDDWKRHGGRHVVSIA